MALDVSLFGHFRHEEEAQNPMLTTTEGPCVSGVQILWLEVFGESVDHRLRFAIRGCRIAENHAHDGVAGIVVDSKKDALGCFTVEMGCLLF